MTHMTQEHFSLRPICELQERTQFQIPHRSPSVEIPSPADSDGDSGGDSDSSATLIFGQTR